MGLPLDIYADVVNVNTRGQTVTMTFGVDASEGEAKTANIVAVMRVPPLVAKQLSIILRKHLKAYEEKSTVLVMPPEFFTRVGIAPEDW